MGNEFFCPSRPRHEQTNAAEKRHCVLMKPVHTSEVTCLAKVEPGMCLSGAKSGAVALVNYETGECIRRWIGHDRGVTKVAFGSHGDHQLIFSGSRDANIIMWNPEANVARRTFAGHQLTISGLALSADFRQLCSGSRDNTVRLWDVETGKLLENKAVAQNLVTHIAWCYDTNLLAQSSEDKELKLWDARNLDQVFSFPKKQYIQMHCDISQDGNYCLTCSNGFNLNGCELTVYDLRQRRILREYFGHQQSVNGAVFFRHDCQTLLLSVSTDHTVRLWNMDTAECLWTEYIVAGGSLLSVICYDCGSVVVSGQNACICHLKLHRDQSSTILQNRCMQIMQSATA